MNIEILIYSLIVTAVSGLTFVAYRHPNGYKKIYSAIIPFIAVSLIIYFAWNLGMMYGGIRWIGEYVIDNPDKTISNSSIIDAE